VYFATSFSFFKGGGRCLNSFSVPLRLVVRLAVAEALRSCSLAVAPLPAPSTAAARLLPRRRALVVVALPAPLLLLLLGLSLRLGLRLGLRLLLHHVLKLHGLLLLLGEGLLLPQQALVGLRRIGSSRHVHSPVAPAGHPAGHSAQAEATAAVVVVSRRAVDRHVPTASAALAVARVAAAAAAPGVVVPAGRLPALGIFDSTAAGAAWDRSTEACVAHCAWRLHAHAGVPAAEAVVAWRPPGLLLLLLQTPADHVTSSSVAAVAAGTCATSRAARIVAASGTTAVGGRHALSVGSIPWRLAVSLLRRKLPVAAAPTAAGIAAAVEAVLFLFNEEGEQTKQTKCVKMK